MSYFDRLAEAAFVKSPSGAQAFYAWGPLGHGRVIASEELRQSLQRAIKQNLLVFYFFLLPLGAVACAALPLMIGVAVWALLCLMNGFQYYLAVWRKVSRLPRADGKWPLVRPRVHLAARHSLGTLVGLETISTVFAAGSVFTMIAARNDTVSWLMGLSGVIFFGFCSVECLHAILTKSKKPTRHA